MENIALAFSGGGFRAAAYSMGCLSYLNKLQYKGKPLLQNVKYISSTSGGSITNLLYSSFVFQGKSFKEFYTYLNQKLEGDAMLKEALELLNDANQWKQRKDKNQNLINAFSLVYDKLLEEKDFGLFFNRKHHPHLEEICVNATEFTNGLPFRFQSQHPNKEFPSGEIGNFYIKFTTSGIEKASKIKLADILASSSCFPSGFEPLIFPEDYANEKVSKKELLTAISFTANEFTITDANTNTINSKNYNNNDFFKDESFDKKKQFGIMDGGITDNQAIDAFVKADDRRKKNKLDPFDLLISCDVSSYFMDGYTLPIRKHKWYDFMSINFFKWISIVLALWLPGILTWDIFFQINWQPWHYISTTLTGLFTLAWIVALINKITKKKTTDSWNTVLNQYKGKFFSLSLGMLKQMISSRAKSVFILANDVYLKQIRRMYYEKMFQNEEYKKRVIQNTIYDLSNVNFNGIDISTAELQPSRKMIETAEKARTMGTTLWFDNNHKKNKIKEAIIATGQFTTCYNLLNFINKKEANKLTPELLEIKSQLQKDWRSFCENPETLLSQKL